MKSPRLGEVAAKPSSLPVRRVNAWTAGSAEQDALEHAHLAVGLRERRAGRRPVVEDESALVHLREEAGADHPGEPEPSASRSAARDHAPRRRCPSIQPIAPAVALLEPRRARGAGSGAAGARRAMACAAGARAHCATTAGISVIASTSESSTATASAMRERAEELAHHAGEQAERREDHDGGQRRAGHGAEDLVGAAAASPRPAARPGAAPAAARCSPPPPPRRR